MVETGAGIIEGDPGAIARGTSTLTETVGGGGIAGAGAKVGKQLLITAGKGVKKVAEKTGDIAKKAIENLGSGPMPGSLKAQLGAIGVKGEVPDSIKTVEQLQADAKAIHGTAPEGRAYNGTTVATGDFDGQLIYTVNQNKTSRAMRKKADELGYERVFGKKYTADNQTDAEQIMLNWAEANEKVGPGKTARIAPSRPACGPSRQNCAGRIDQTDGVELIGPRKEK